MVKLVRVDNGYIVAEAVVIPVIDLKKIDISRVLGAVDTEVNRLSPVFPEKEMAEMWWESVSGISDAIEIGLPEWLIEDIWRRTFVYHMGRDGEDRRIRVFDYVKCLLLLYGVARSEISGYITPFKYGRVMRKFCSVVSDDISRDSAMRLYNYASVRSYYSMVKVRPKRWYREKISRVVKKYACKQDDGWYYVMKSDAPEMANELLSVRWW